MNTTACPTYAERKNHSNLYLYFYRFKDGISVVERFSIRALTGRKTKD
ncbi:MAG: hypothetical protein K1Y36_24785 [Blastocatellia bacterium]|nr:hypothetical protein [Blastocatellia bacterium]